MQLQKVSALCDSVGIIALYYVLFPVLSVFINLRSEECVCSYYRLVSAHKQKIKLNYMKLAPETDGYRLTTDNLLTVVNPNFKQLYGTRPNTYFISLSL